MGCSCEKRKVELENDIITGKVTKEEHQYSNNSNLTNQTKAKNDLILLVSVVII
jgi:hypothetical protein